MTKTLDTKIADILQNPSSSKAFIIADAKDADMAFGVAAPGPRRTPKRGFAIVSHSNARPYHVRTS
jgi:hypothetical protein